MVLLLSGSLRLIATKPGVGENVVCNNGTTAIRKSETHSYQAWSRRDKCAITVLLLSGSLRLIDTKPGVGEKTVCNNTSPSARNFSFSDFYLAGPFNFIFNPLHSFYLREVWLKQVPIVRACRVWGTDITSQCLCWGVGYMRGRWCDACFPLFTLQCGLVFLIHLLTSPHLAGSSSRGGDVAVHAFDDKSTELTHSFLFCSCVYFCLHGLPSVFHFMNSPDNYPLSRSVFPVLFLPHWSLQLYISVGKSPSTLIKSSVAGWA